MRMRIAAIAALAMLAMSLYRAAREVQDWRKPRSSDVEFEEFVERARQEIPPNDRVRVTAPIDPRWIKNAQLLSTRLHPRLLVAAGPADWILEITESTDSRFRATIRRAMP